MNYNNSGIRTNCYNLTSPFKPIKTDTFEIEKSFTDQNGLFNPYLQSSPIFGKQIDGLF